MKFMQKKREHSSAGNVLVMLMYGMELFTGRTKVTFNSDNR